MQRGRRRRGLEEALSAASQAGAERRRQAGGLIRRGAPEPCPEVSKPCPAAASGAGAVRRRLGRRRSLGAPRGWRCPQGGVAGAASARRHLRGGRATPLRRQHALPRGRHALPHRRERGARRRLGAARRHGAALQPLNSRARTRPRPDARADARARRHGPARAAAGRYLGAADARAAHAAPLHARTSCSRRAVLLRRPLVQLHREDTAPHSRGDAKAAGRRRSHAGAADARLSQGAAHRGRDARRRCGSGGVSHQRRPVLEAGADRARRDVTSLQGARAEPQDPRAQAGQVRRRRASARGRDQRDRADGAAQGAAAQRAHHRARRLGGQARAAGRLPGDGVRRDRPRAHAAAAARLGARRHPLRVLHLHVLAADAGRGQRHPRGARDPRRPQARQLPLRPGLAQADRLWHRQAVERRHDKDRARLAGRDCQLHVAGVDHVRG
mmetsp:Transcript_43982/g.139294  ORF Transcript_43982/g.139294 Transcript_43982/m.139294 type:complete len:442 (-) Transcript_43982:1133-2458(-)